MQLDGRSGDGNTVATSWRRPTRNGYADWAARWRVPLGFAFGAAYLTFAQPTARLLEVGAAISCFGLALRAVAAGCVDKNEGLATCGPYACTRNPLYLGSLITGSGLAFAGASWILGLAFLLLFVLVYYPVMRREEDWLRGRFGETYERYAQRVPLFLPNGRRAARSGDTFRWARYRKNREYEASLGFAFVIIFLILKLKLK
jgi:protein-S-isoprenylcysteine O-methyltransferase Ste14